MSDMMESSYLMEEESQSGENSRRPLGSSRRRIQKNTAVVLNADRLKRFALEESSNSILEDSVLSYVTTNATNNNNQGSDKSSSITKLMDIIPPESQLDKTFDHLEERQAYDRLCSWWKRMKTNNSKNQKKPSFSFISISNTTRGKLFSLLLGWRVRKIMQFSKVKQICAEHRDVKMVLYDLLVSNKSSPSNQPSRRPEDAIEDWIRSRKAQSIPADQVLTGVDHSLAQSLVRQLLAEREKLLQEFFRNCAWSPFPIPGYWKLDLLSHLKTKEKTPVVANSNFSSPPRPSQIIQETPPHVKSSMQQASQGHIMNQQKQSQAKVPVKLFVSHNNSRLIDDTNIELVGNSEHVPAAGRAMPRSLKEVMDSKIVNDSSSFYEDDRPLPTLAKASNGQDDRPITASAADRGLMGVGSSSISTHQSRFSARPATADPSLGGNSTGKAVAQKRASTAPSSQKKRSQEGGHIQLDILSGDRLMPARKGANMKDANIEPDRKPCLKITLFLPHAGGPTSQRSSPMSLAGGGNSTMKRVFHVARDFEVITLHPQWDCSVSIPLPFFKTAFKALNTKSIQSNNPLSQEDYEKVCKCLLDSWCNGLLLVDVVDGERFNEDIFMGQVKILMTSFMPLVKKMNELEIKGTFQLEKLKPTDRVSGSIRLHAYLHVPEKDYIEEQLAHFRASGGVETSRRKSTGAVLPAAAIAAHSPAAPPTSAIPESRRPYNGADEVIEDGEIINNQQSSKSIRSSSRSRRASAPDHVTNIEAASSSSRLRKLKKPTPSSSSAKQSSKPYPSTDDGADHDSDTPDIRAPVNKLHYASQFMQEIAESIEKINLDKFAFDEISPRGDNPQVKEHVVSSPEKKESSARSRAISAPSPRHSGANHPVRMMAQDDHADPHVARRPSRRLGNRDRGEQESERNKGNDDIKEPANNREKPPLRHISSIVSKEAAMESSQVKRNFINDMAKQLDGLSAMLSDFSQKQQAKRQAKQKQSDQVAKVDSRGNGDTNSSSTNNRTPTLKSRSTSPGMLSKKQELQHHDHEEEDDDAILLNYGRSMNPRNPSSIEAKPPMKDHDNESGSERAPSQLLNLRRQRLAALSAKQAPSSAQSTAPPPSSNAPPNKANKSVPLGESAAPSPGRRTPIAQELEDCDLPELEESDLGEVEEEERSSSFHIHDKQQHGLFGNGYHSDDYDDDIHALRSRLHAYEHDSDDEDDDDRFEDCKSRSFDDHSHSYSFDEYDVKQQEQRKYDHLDDDGDEHEDSEDFGHEEIHVIGSPPGYASGDDAGVAHSSENSPNDSYPNKPPHGWKPPPPPPRISSRQAPPPPPPPPPPPRSSASLLTKPVVVEQVEQQIYRSPPREAKREVTEEENVTRPSPRWKKRLPKATLQLNELEL